MFHALTPRTFADGDVQGIVSRRAEQVQVAGAETADGLRIEKGLRHRCKGDLAPLAR